MKPTPSAQRAAADADLGAVERTHRRIRAYHHPPAVTYLLAGIGVLAAFVLLFKLRTGWALLVVPAWLAAFVAFPFVAPPRGGRCVAAVHERGLVLDAGDTTSVVRWTDVVSVEFQLKGAHRYDGPIARAVAVREHRRYRLVLTPDESGESLVVDLDDYLLQVPLVQAIEAHLADVPHLIDLD